LKLLHIESATTLCSVAISENRLLLGEKSVDEGFKHAEILNGMVKEILKETDSKPAQLSAISVSIGPGSYTGLRIGLSFCKGLCYGLNVPIISISTLHSMAANAKKNLNPGLNQLLVPMIDARRMEVYTSVFDSKLSVMEETSAMIIDKNSFENYMNKELIFFGNGAEKCKPFISGTSFSFINKSFCEASGQVEIASDLFLKNEFSNLTYLEPFYLKEFQTNIKAK
jgi:tRNA threonylcarbamoyladenosine biosynthesis protein TsaB